MKKERLNKKFLADFKDYDFLKIKENKSKN